MNPNELIFPTEGIPQDWGNEFSFVTNHGLLVCEAHGELDTERAIRISHRVHILHWVVKLRFNPKHKIPFFVPRKQRETYKELGSVYRWALEMCIEGHAFSQTPYYNAAEWFRHILIE